MGLGKTVHGPGAARHSSCAFDRRPTALSWSSRCARCFNWRQDGTVHTRSARSSSHVGGSRAADARILCDHDVVLTTYGTLRRDAGSDRRCTFDYVVLDEAAGRSRTPRASAKATRAAARAPSPRAERHADRKPSRRALEPVRIPQPGACSAAPTSFFTIGDWATPPRSDAAFAPREAIAGPAPVHPAPDQGAGRLGPAAGLRGAAMPQAGTACRSAIWKPRLRTIGAPLLERRAEQGSADPSWRFVTGRCCGCNDVKPAAEA